MFRPDCRIYLVYSKWDEVVSGNLDEELQPLLTRFEGEIGDLLSKTTQGPGFFRVAASPKLSPELGIGYGLEELVNHWLTKLGRKMPQAIDLARPQRIAVREFDRYRRS